MIRPSRNTAQKSRMKDNRLKNGEKNQRFSLNMKNGSSRKKIVERNIVKKKKKQ